MTDLMEGIYRIPDGTYLPPEWGACEGQFFCRSTREASAIYTCWRRLGHCGRHATILNDGTVIARWGEDVHADARARGHAALESRAIDASNARQSAFYAKHDRTKVATR